MVFKPFDAALQFLYKSRQLAGIAGDSFRYLQVILFKQHPPQAGNIAFDMPSLVFGQLMQHKALEPVEHLFGSRGKEHIYRFIKGTPGVHIQLKVEIEFQLTGQMAHQLSKKGIDGADIKTIIVVQQRLQHLAGPLAKHPGNIHHPGRFKISQDGLTHARIFTCRQ